MFTAITKKLVTPKRLLLLGLGALALILALPHVASAQDAITSSTDSINSLYQEFIEILIVVMEFLQRLLWPVLLMIGGLLKNDILFSAGMEEVALSIWENVRNIVNILFVLILLGIALYNVVGGSNQDYHIKTIIPKFVIALVAVNFSFLGIKVIVDGVNVLSTAIFALPGAVERGLETGDESFALGICEGIYGKDGYEETVNQAYEEWTANEERPEAEPWCNVDKEFTQRAQNFFADFDSHNAAIVLAVNMAELDLLDTVNVRQPSLRQLMVNSLFSATLYIVYAVSFVALMIVLLIRLVVIWIAMVLSPLIALSFVLPESLSGGGGGLKEQLVKSIIVPIPVSVVMSIGFIMLQALKQARFSGLSLGTSALGVNLLTSGLSTLQDVIVAVGMVAFIWVGVFKAMEGTAAQGIVEKIKGATEGFGKFAATAPFKYAPIIPVGEAGEKVGAGTALAALQQIPQQFEATQYEKARELAGGYSGASVAQLGEGLKEAAGKGDARAFAQALINAGPGISKNRQTQQQIYDALKGTSARFQQEVQLQMLKNKKGEALTAVQALEALRKGEIDEASLEAWIESNRNRFRLTPEKPTTETKKDERERGQAAEPPQTTPGQEGAQKVGAAAITAGAATGLMGTSQFDHYTAGLSDDQKAAIKKFKDNPESIDDEDVQEAFKQAQDMREGMKKFKEDMTEPLAKTGDEREKGIITVIRTRKEEVTKIVKQNNPGLDEDALNKKVNEIVDSEIEGIPGVTKKAEEVNTAE